MCKLSKKNRNIAWSIYSPFTDWQLKFKGAKAVWNMSVHTHNQQCVYTRNQWYSRSSLTKEIPFFSYSLHKKLSFPLSISSLNVTKSTWNCGFFVQCLISFKKKQCINLSKTCLFIKKVRSFVSVFMTWYANNLITQWFWFLSNNLLSHKTVIFERVVGKTVYDVSMPQVSRQMQVGPAGPAKTPCH